MRGDWINAGKIELIKAYRGAYASQDYKTLAFSDFTRTFDNVYCGDIQAFGFYINDHDGWMQDSDGTTPTHIAGLLHTKNWVEANYIFSPKSARYVGNPPPRNFKDLHNAWALLIVKAHSV